MSSSIPSASCLPAEGGCDCRAVRYRMGSAPMIQPWVLLPPGTPSFEAYYEREAIWPAPSLARRQMLLPLIEAYQASQRGAA
jgi:hypothetical protein